MDKTYFMHRRPLTEDGHPGPRGGVTAYIVLKYNEETRESFVLYSLARCSFLDNFARVVGRRIATGRFTAGRAQGFHLTAMPLDEAKKRIYETVAEVCDRELTAAANQFKFVKVAEQQVKEAQRVLRELVRHQRGRIAA